MKIRYDKYSLIDVIKPSTNSTYRDDHISFWSFMKYMPWTTCVYRKAKDSLSGRRKDRFFFNPNNLHQSLLWVSRQSQQMGKRINPPHICKHQGETSLSWTREYKDVCKSGVKLRVPIRRRWVSVREWRLSYKMILLEVNQYGGLMKTTLLASFERSMALFRQDSPQGTDAREGVRSLPLVFIGRSCYKLSWSGLETSPVP